MTRIQIQCAECGFPFRFVDEDVEYSGWCPLCHRWTEQVEVEVEVPDPEYAWFVVDRSGTPIKGPFAGEGDGYRWILRSGARGDDYPHDSLTVSFLPIPPQHRQSRVSDPHAVVERLRSGLRLVQPLDRRQVETPSDQAFWTPDRVIILAHLEIAAA